MAALRRVLAARGSLSAEDSRRLARIEALFDVPVGTVSAERQHEPADE